MKVYKDLSIEIEGTNTHYFDFGDFENESQNKALYYGYTFICNNAHEDLLKKHDHNIYLNVVPPTEFCGPYDVKVEDRFDEIYSICPYTAEWLNKIKSADKYKKIWYPFNKKYIPSTQEKKYDVCYHGGIHGQKYFEMLQILNNFKYRYMTMTHDINPTTQYAIPMATDLDLSNSEKLIRIGECKISVCYNNFPVRNIHDVNAVKSQDRWQENKAFAHVESHGILPQLKSRFIEASLCKTLNLVERDPWNVIEEWYEPDKHFVYFEGNDGLEKSISKILSNWSSYQDIIEESYNHSFENYCCDSVIDYMQN